METNTNTKRVTLASLVASVLEASGSGDITVKNALESVQELIKSNGLNISCNYRGVYQQLKHQAVKSNKGTFRSANSTSAEIAA
jgi:phage-related protein